MDFTEAKKQKVALEEKVSACSKRINAFPKNAMGMTPDHIRATPEFKAAKDASRHAFARLQRFNTWYIGAFKAEILAERRAKYPQMSL